MDNISKTRLQELYPPLSDKVIQLITQLELEGLEYRVVQGLRSWSQQDALYAQGRTIPGEIVTNVQGGYSYHNYGLAVDIVPSLYAPDQPFDPDWNSSHPIWQRMIQLGISLDLDSGATWRTFKDFPHFQYTGNFPEGEPSDEVRQLFKDGGMQAVWDEITNQTT